MRACHFHPTSPPHRLPQKNIPSPMVRAVARTLTRHDHGSPGLCNPLVPRESLPRVGRHTNPSHRLRADSHYRMPHPLFRGHCPHRNSCHVCRLGTGNLSSIIFSPRDADCDADHIETIRIRLILTFRCIPPLNENLHLYLLCLKH